jgi:hypothetical protein
MATKLEAVNDVLRRLGKFVVPNLDAGGSSTQAQVLRCIDDSLDRIQGMGWYWNTKHDVEVEVVGGDGDDATYIRVDQLESFIDTGQLSAFSKVYHVDTDMEDIGHAVVRQGKYLYDLDDNTLSIGETLKLTYSYQLAFQDVPHTFMEWAIADAALEMNRTMSYAQTMTTFNRARDSILQERAATTQKAAMQEEIRAQDVNVLNTEEMRQIRGRRRTPNRSIY